MCGYPRGAGVSVLPVFDGLGAVKAIGCDLPTAARPEATWTILILMS
jgi:hypothetical protein